MSQSLGNVLVHLIFSTKDRRPLITDSIREPLHRYITGIFQHHDSPLITTNSVDDHIHVLFKLSRKFSIAEIVEQVKSGSSGWIKKQLPEFRDFYWQGGYGAFSIGQSQVDQVKGYIARQPEHHQRESFQEEFRKILRRYEVEHDERYVWD